MFVLAPLEGSTAADGLALSEAAANELAYNNLWAQLNRQQADEIVDVNSALEARTELCPRVGTPPGATSS